MTGVSSGTYTVTVTDDNGCSVTTSATVGQATSLTASATTTDASCNGGTDGGVDVTVSGGTSPYTFVWSNGSTTEDLTGVSSGTYDVTVTDENGCSVTTSATVGQATSLTASATTTDASCNGGTDGGVDLTVSGGTLPYTFNWSNGSTTEDLTGVSSGTYTVTVTDDNGCSVTTSATVGQATSLTASTTTTDASCNGGTDGGVDLTITGGTLPYTFTWSNGSTTEDLTGVTAGTYDVTVTDGNGCSTTVSATVGQATSLTASTTTTDASCNGGTDGGVDVTVTGGTSPYTFVWSNGETTEDLTGVSSGTYTVTVTDDNGCSTTVSATIGESSSLTATAISSGANCDGSGNGSVDVSVSGGTLPYTFAWSNGETTEDLTGLSVGTYTVTVTDANGCSTTASATVTAPGGLAATISSTDITCNGSGDGSIDVGVSGGTLPYTFAWSNGEITEDLTALQAGTYTATITDANGCATTVSAILVEPASLTATIGSISNASCDGSTLGDIDLLVNGGTLPYSYNWSNGQTTEDISAGPGTYTVTVTDANGCTVLNGAVIPLGLIATVDAVSDVGCDGSGIGAIEVSITGGIEPYTYNWSNGAATEDLTGINPGTYTLTVTDANDCSAVATATIFGSSAISASAATTNVVCGGAQNGSIALTVSGGLLPYTFLWSNGETSEDLDSLAGGDYSVTITGANACSTTVAVTLTENPAMEIEITGAGDVLCSGDYTGFVEITVSGAVQPYTYLWSNGATVEDLYDVPSGLYQVTVTDQIGCTSSMAWIVKSVLPIDATPTFVQPTCDQPNGGSISLVTIGGTPIADIGYNYAWNTGATTAAINGLTAGTYTVTISDVNGCQGIEVFTIGDNAAPTITAVRSKLSGWTRTDFCDGAK